MLEQFDLTQTLGLILALYMGAASIGLLLDSEGYADMVDDFVSNPAITYIAAVVAFAMGATIVALHNLWSTPLEFIVSLVGWAALIEGVLMMAFRRPFITLVGALPINPGFAKIYGAVVLCFTALLLFLILGAG